MIENKNAGVFISIIWDSFFSDAGRTLPTPDVSCRRRTKLADAGRILPTQDEACRRWSGRLSFDCSDWCQSIYYGGGSLARDAANFQVDIAIISGSKLGHITEGIFASSQVLLEYFWFSLVF